MKETDHDKKGIFGIFECCFKMFGCKQYKKKFVYEHEEVYITFMISRSNFSEAYYHEFNCTIKCLHPEIKPSEISVKDFDFVVRPRLVLAPKMIPMELYKLDVKEYEKLLHSKLESFFKSVNERGLMFIRDHEKKGCDLTKDAHELLRYRRG